ncbi:hypothetical protein MBLNU230_g3256t1 [Neophaeotheca triangularis]
MYRPTYNRHDTEGVAMEGAPDQQEAPGRDKNLPRFLAPVMPQKLADKKAAATKSPHDPSQNYLVGMRGCLAIMSFLWVFLETFAPATVKGSANDTGPAPQIALRKSLSVLFWNDSLIYSSIIFLSARTICLPFLLDPTNLTLMSVVLRRGIRLWIPVAVCFIVLYIVFSLNLGNQYLFDFADATSNVSMSADMYIMPNSLSNFNSLFNVFWISHGFETQSGNWAFPSQTMWIVTAIFQQSYTVFVAMVIIPYTRKSWRVWGAFLFILTAWWVYSWAWFSISGLLLADVIMNMGFREKSKAGISLGPIRFPAWPLYILVMAAGWIMQFIWVAALPELANEEIKYHTGLYDTGGLYTWNDPNNPQLRADIYLIIIGFWLLLETFAWMRAIFANPVFRFLGERSFSYFLLQSIIIYTLGIKLCTDNMGEDLANYESATGIAFIATLLVTLAAGEVFYWVFERPTKVFARFVFDWIRE